MNPIRYVIVTPVRNEEVYLGKTVDSVVSQTIQPAEWIIVDDGSTDKTGEIADAASTRHGWICVLHRADRGFRKAGGGVMEAFHDGLHQLQTSDWDFLVKLDGDLSFEKNYFESCLNRFAGNSKLGIGGGTICRLGANVLVAESHGDPRFHVRGATKIYRRDCWEQIGGLLKRTGWDTVDELKANMLGWETLTFEDVKVLQHKDTGSADGAWRNSVKNGFANYVSAYHPLFMLAKCLKRVSTRPYFFNAFGLAVGFAGGYVRRAPRVDDPALVDYVRRQQIRKLTLRSSIWD
jgi:glycosyltransferase involved in cell wall biosynthesis